MWGESTSSNTTVAGTENDIEIVDTPNSIVSAMEFSPFQTIRRSFLATSYHDLTVRIWEVRRSRKIERKLAIALPALVLDVSWSIDGKGFYMASGDNKLKFLDLENSTLMCRSRECHIAPVKTCNAIKESNYKNCVMTGSWDKTMKIWDPRCIVPVVTILFSDKIACADVDDTMMVVCTEQGRISVYELGNSIQMVKELITPLQSEPSCVAIFRDRITGKPAGFTIGTLEGYMFTLYMIDNPNYVALVLRGDVATNVTMTPSIKTNTAINDVKFHPVHHTLAVTRSNGHCSFYNTEPNRISMLSDKLCQLPIMKCCFNKDGKIFAYNTGHNISKYKILTRKQF
ncbi:mRNA export factor-like [Acyrthosiphon pisum]|uniref:WD repeat-containing protein 55 homolog n=1 Tax=Acyrthosiphon pisum TaxID=7029 RepID=A0A8R2A754_ACYPI|nr:mRNA export factor-like [Acyrthosiphon pisum]|eukprot:XP_001947267.1 PREDICTED: mRNA export factor-like [Acyrthosiphon pisum]